MAQRYLGRSPRKDVSSQLDQHSNKIKEILKNDLAMLKQENLILKNKCTKIGDLQQKVDTLVRQNAALHNENQKLTQLANQRRSQLEILKNRMDSHAQQKYGESVSHQFQVKKLLAEIDHLSAEIKQIQHLKAVQISQLKSQFQLQLQASKKTQVASQDVYQNQIRKLRQQLQRKDYQLNEYLNKMRRISSQSEYQILRLKQEKQKLKTELGYLQADKKNDLQMLRQKMQLNYAQQIQTLRRNHVKNIQNLQIDNLRLKDSLDVKIMQIQQLNSKVFKQKSHYQDTISILKRQNDTIRAKLIQLQRMNDEQFLILRDKMDQVHLADIQQIKINHQRVTTSLQNQILKLQAHLKNKTQQVQQMIKQKSMVRNTFQSDVNRYKDQINQGRSKVSQLQKTIARTIDDYQLKLRQKDKNISYLENLNADQQNNNDKQITSLKQLLDHTKRQLQSQKMNFQQKQQNYVQSLNKYKNQSFNLRDELKRQKGQKQRIQQQLKNQLHGTSHQMKTKIQGVNTKYTVLQRQNDSLRNALSAKQKQNKILNDQVQNSLERQRTLEKQCDDYRDKMIKKDQRMNQLIKTQKERLQESYQNMIQNIKNDNQKNLKAEANRFRDLQQRYKKKEKEVQQLLKKYKKMIGQVEVLKDQQANKKELTLKYPGATADLIASKNLFDVYLKTKVLDVCSDVMRQSRQDKQN